jgi:hypothetical protein
MNVKNKKLIINKLNVQYVRNILKNQKDFLVKIVKLLITVMINVKINIIDYIVCIVKILMNLE